MFHKMPFILLAIITIILLAGSAIPLEVKQVLLAASITIKSIILFLLPIVIFGLLFRAAEGLMHQATKLIFIVFAGVIISNFIATFLSHYVGSLIYHFNLSIPLPTQVNALQPAWLLELPKLIPNDKAMLAGISLGLLSGRFFPKKAAILANKLEILVSAILKLFIFMIPVFVAGSMIKLQEEGVFVQVIKDYTLIFAMVAIAQFAYINLGYILASKGRIKEWISSLKNMIPAAISGISTMSSAASMPLTILGVEKNTKNKMIAKSVVPATVNIHLMGDCFAIPIFAYAVMKSFGMSEPSLLMYLTFTFFFVISKFSVAGVPGGGILVMLPVLEANLGFTSGMLSLITALYILFDPVITCANVMGNGAFAKIIDSLAGKQYEKTDTLAGGFAKA